MVIEQEGALGPPLAALGGVCGGCAHTYAGRFRAAQGRMEQSPFLYLERERLPCYHTLSANLWHLLCNTRPTG